MKRGVLLAVALLAAAPAMARDARLEQRSYDPDEIVRVEGGLGMMATIVFGEAERIENVAIGDSGAWQVTPNKRANLLFVKPLNARARTNMTVVTDRHTYVFDLVAGRAASPVYVLRFTYPDDPAPPPAAVAPALTPEEARLAAGEAPRDPAALNFAWARKGDAKIMPLRIYDDGDAVYLAWRPGVEVPAILTRNDKGEIGPVNYAVRGDTLVIEGVPSVLLLRSGRNEAVLENRGNARKSAVAAAPSDAAAQPMSTRE